MKKQKTLTSNSLQLIFKLIRIFFFLIFRFVIILRYLQSKFTSHEKLNRVKNIFKNCCSILLNNEWCKMSCNDINNNKLSKKIRTFASLINKILNCLLMIDEIICKTRANYLISKKFTTCTFYKIQCTNQFSYMRKYQCVKRRNNDFVDTTKRFFSCCNRFDISKIFSESISQTIARIFSHETTKIRIFNFLHSISRTKSRKSQQTFARLFRLFFFFLQHLHRYLNQHHLNVQIFRLRHIKSHQNRWRNNQSIVHLHFRFHFLEHLYQNIKNFISLSMIWFALHQSRIIVYFLFAINQKTSIKQNLKNSNLKSFRQFTFAKTIRFVLSEKSIYFSKKTLMRNIFKEIYCIHVLLNAMYTSIIACA